MRALRVLPLAVTLLFAAACGDSGTGPSEPDFPLIQGTYDLNAPVDGLPGARFSGTMTVLDDSRDTAEFDGTASINLILGTTNEGNFSGDIVSGQVTEAGVVSFNIGDSRFRWNGTLSGTTITGTWLLQGTDQNFTGTFTASRR